MTLGFRRKEFEIHQMKTYRDLEIFKTSKKLATRVHVMSLKLAKFELFEEGSQIRRSSKAVTTSIVEGYGRRRYKMEFIRYLIFAQAECDETIVHLDFLWDTDSLRDKSLYLDLVREYDILSKQINKFIQWVEKYFNSQLSNKPETGTGNGKPATGNWRPATGNKQPETGN
jgi:four helix bundle protein